MALTHSFLLLKRNPLSKYAEYGEHYNTYLNHSIICCFITGSININIIVCISLYICKFFV